MNIEMLRRSHVRLMRYTLETIGNILATVTEEEAKLWRDGEDGWTVLEIVCHLKDFDEVFYQRAVRILTEDNPQLAPVDHEALAIERRYNEQSLPAVMAEFSRSRGAFREFFVGIAAEDWGRSGIHPERGQFSLGDALIQVGTHDVNHIEQMTRVIAQGRQAV